MSLLLIGASNLSTSRGPRGGSEHGGLCLLFSWHSSLLICRKSLLKKKTFSFFTAKSGAADFLKKEKCFTLFLILCIAVAFSYRANKYSPCHCQFQVFFFLPRLLSPINQFGMFFATHIPFSAFLFFSFIPLPNSWLLFISISTGGRFSFLFNRW